jgi:hypothetical protein
MLYTSKKNDYIINLDKEIYRIDLLKKIIVSFKITKYDIIRSYSYKTTKYDPLIINKVNNKKLMSNDKYKLIIKEINRIEDNYIDVKYSVQNNNVQLEYNNYIYSISVYNYYRIKQQIIDKSYKKYTSYNGLLWCLLHRYTFFEMLNGLFGSVLPQRYLQFGKPSEIFECFGSFYNHTSKYFCGLFFDLEKYFGCIGNFFDTTFEEGIFFANPPFDISIINKMNKKIISNINKYNMTTFLIIIPTWNIDDRISLNKICKIKLLTDFITDIKLDPIIKHSKLITRYLYCKEKFPYYNFINNKIINYASTDLILIGNKININLQNIFNKPDIIYKFT